MVLFITGFAEHAVLGNGVLAPGMQVITKPFTMHSPVAKVRPMVQAEADGNRASAGTPRGN